MFGETPPPGGGTEVPVEPLTPTNARRFLLYESTDALQDNDPFGPRAMDLFARLHAFELDLLFESALYDVGDADEREALKAKLRDLYVNLAPAEWASEEALASPSGAPIEVGEVRFQSIADLYNKAILPLYQEAIHYGRVPHTNLGLEGELQDPNYAAEGFLPILPVHRDKNFDKAAKDDADDPLRGYKRVKDVIAEIVEEGEGQEGFEQGAEALLAKVTELGGARGYLDALNADTASESPSPEWLDECQRIRLSHLYRFAMTMIDLDHETELACAAGTEFTPARTPLRVGLHPELDVLASTMAAQFNAVYLALVMWLGRIYEIKTWESDRRRRMGIEMLAAWPMMSIAIRPFLELAAFLPVEPRALFRLERVALPDAPVHARQLLALYTAPKRSQKINDRMDYYALHALSDVAAWAAEQRAAITGLDDLDPHVLRALTARLDSLATLDEFERQFPYREHGGYSDRAPDQAFLMTHPDANQYEEDGSQEQLFADSLVLRIRFAGRELVQLATDPDPPTDEAGCTGTHMLHAADGDNHWFDRALVWQPELPEAANVIRREPRERLPPVGIRAAELDLLVTGDQPAQSGYLPLGVMSSAGAVQTQGVQQVARVTGLEQVETLTAEGVRVGLLPKDGRMPFLNGYNHLVWQDGEPIDPFILAVLGQDGAVAWQREIFNEGKRLLQMSPLQRLYSTRGPCGFDFDLSDIPPWVPAMLSQQERDPLANPRFPISYLKARAGVLTDALKASLAAPEVAPRGSRCDGVLCRAAPPCRHSARHDRRLARRAPLNYGHTVSGEQETPATPALPAGLTTATGLKLELAPPSRKPPNGRWFVSYTQGFMDTDALSAMIYGELYMPLIVTSAGEPVTFTRRWRFPVGLENAVAAYAVRFAAPFWADFHVDGDTRTIELPDGTIITERLTDSTHNSYEYTATGVPGIVDYLGSFAVESDPEAIVLAWTTTFTPADAATAVRMFSINAGGAAAMTAKLDSHFSPA